MSTRRRVVDIVETIAAHYGFREIGMPHLERTQMYINKSSGEVVEGLYAFEDEGDREVALTPELTPTVARMVITEQQALPRPIKWVSTRPFWRCEQVQQGRFHEFYQINADISGSSGPEAGARILAFYADALADLGLTADDFEFHVSHRDTLESLLRSFDVDMDVTDAVHAIDKSEKVERTEYLGLLSDTGLSYDQTDEFTDPIERGDPNEIAAFGGNDAEAAVENLRNVLAVTDDFGAGEFCEVSLPTARGLDYYTSVVFECFDSTGDMSRAAFGGGRYSNLIGLFGDQSTPVVGVDIGGAALQLLYQHAGVWPDEELATGYYLLTVGDARGVASDITRGLRATGNVVEVDVSGRSFGAQMSYIDSINADAVVIVSEHDLENDEVTVKDMVSGDQATIPVDDLPGDHDAPTYGDHR